MQSFTVRDLMVPLSEYATVPEGATLFEAVMALEKAQEEFDHSKYRHRGILVLNKNNQVIGKINQVDVLRALEPQNGNLDDIKALHQFSFSSKFVRRVYKQRRMHGEPLNELCRKAMKVRVEDCMQTSFAADKFDSVFLANVIHVIADPLKAIQESHRILKDGGTLVVVSFTNAGMTWFETLKLGLRFLKAWGRPPRHAQSFSPDKLGSLLETAGFVVEKAQLLGNETKAVFIIGKKN